MSATGTNVQNKEVLWFAGTVGTIVAVATLAYSRRRQNRWDRVASNLRPWIGRVVSAASVVSAARLRRLAAETTHHA